MRYKVKKKPATRIAYRLLGLMFILIALAEVWAVFHMISGGKVLLIMMAVFLIIYGGYLIKMSFRRQAYDITYVFEEPGMRIIHRRGVERLPYSEVEDVEIIAPNPDMEYRILKLKIKNIVYVIPFSHSVELAESIFQYIYDRVEWK
ncbi:MAG: hypothetical protein IKQ71_07170 [Lachnospiraceae bacterium]|nr:hypothetical protein [Lachnospiraceae bacterium]